MPGKHIGLLHISDELILRWLDFNDGGTIKGIRQDPTGYIEIAIEHPDMPEIRIEGSSPQVVSPIYITTEDALGHRVTIRERKINNVQ